MKTPSRFISFCQLLAERLAPLVFGGLTLLTLLNFTELSDLIMSIVRTQTGASLIMSVSRFVMCLASEASHLVLHMVV